MRKAPYIFAAVVSLFLSACCCHVSHKTPPTSTAETQNK
jgi:hypothetical protein